MVMIMIIMIIITIIMIMVMIIYIIPDTGMCPIMMIIDLMIIRFIMFMADLFTAHLFTRACPQTFKEKRAPKKRPKTVQKPDFRRLDSGGPPRRSRPFMDLEAWDFACTHSLNVLCGKRPEIQTLIVKDMSEISAGGLHYLV